MSTDSWSQILKNSGFSGIDLEVRDWERNEDYSLSVMMSTAVGKPDYPSQICIVCPPTDVSGSWIKGLRGSWQQATDASVTVVDLIGFDATDKVCIVLSEIERPILDHFDGDDFLDLQQTLTTAKGVLWVTRGSLIRSRKPEMALIHGLFRTLRSEDVGRRYVSLDLDASLPACHDHNKRWIVNIFKAAFDFSIPSHETDLEYAIDGSVPHILRVQADNNNNNMAVAPLGVDLVPQLRPFLAKDGFKLQHIGVEEVPTGLEILPDTAVEIEPRAFGLNFRDVLVALGQLDEVMMGYECNGIVTKIGSTAASKSGLQVGDRVCSLMRGHYATKVQVDWFATTRIPDRMNFEEAASILLVWATAYHSLQRVASLSEGETVLIHAGTGGVGQAAIMLAQHLGAIVYTTVSTPEKRDFLMKKYRTPAGHIFSSRDSSFGSAVMAATNGRGVDVALNSLAGPLLKETWECMAPFGRFVDIGKRDFEASKFLDMSPLTHAVSFTAVDLNLILKFKGPEVHRMLDSAMKLIASGKVSTVAPIRTFALSDIHKAFRYMQAGKHLGKIVITPNPSDEIKVIPRLIPVGLSPVHSYLILGGMGGLGQSIARWMVEKGARNLVLISRNAETSTGSKALVAELEAVGCKLLVRNCDASDGDSLACAIKDYHQSIPRIKGVIHAAMQLQDSVLQHMTYKEWNSALRPKVAATWNLHNELPDLDFFVMLSSLNGIIGNPSQANFAAENTFQDAFAAWRSSQGRHGVSIDLGPIGGVGYVAQRDGVAERMVKLGASITQERELLRIIELAIRGPSDGVTQLINGLRTDTDGHGDPFRSQGRRFSLISPIHPVSVAGTASEHASSKAGIRMAEASLTQSLQEASETSCAVTLILEALVKKIADMFGMDKDDITVSSPVANYGVDSLIAVELRNWIVSSAGAETTSIFDVLQSPSLHALAEKVAEKSLYLTATFAR